MEIQLVALDMDGTTLRNNHRPSEYTVSAIKRVLEKGVSVVPATGRMQALLPREIIEIEGINYAITSNGAAVVDVRTGERIKTEHVPKEYVAFMLEVLAPHDIFFELYSGGDAYASRKGMTYLQERSGVKESIIDEFFTDRTIVVDDIHTIAEKGIEKVNMPFLSMDVRGQLLEHLLPLEGKVTMTSSDFNNIEVSALGASKGHALEWVAAKLGISPSQVMAVGDNYNDLAMLGFAGVSVAMGNAEQAVREAADFVTHTNEEDGVAAVLERFILKR
jgi:Cof subfamily protein (haloacid dehalogenase superfamily)